MYDAENACWYTDHGYEISVRDLKEQLGQHIFNKGKLRISCDSSVAGQKWVFSSSLCLYGAVQQKERFFWYRRNISALQFDNPNQRMLKEAYSSLGVALWVVEDFPNAEIEIRIDLSSHAKAESFRETFSEMIEKSGFDFSVP